MNKKPWVIFGIAVITAFMVTSASFRYDAEAKSAFFPIKPGWGMDKLWDDGLVEKAVYSAQKVIYGKVREFDAIFLTNMEKADPAKLVKTGNWSDPKAIPVIKFNQVMEIATENYDYRYMVHIYSDRQSLRPLKMLLTSQEWCGTTFKEFLFQKGRASLKSFSYQINDGDEAHELGEFKKGLLFDQLPVALRALNFQKGMKFNVSLLATQVTNNRGSSKITPAYFNYIGEEKVNTPAGAFISHKISMKVEDKTTQFWFEKAYPNVMVKRINPDGTTYIIKSRSRIKYWR